MVREGSGGRKRGCQKELGAAEQEQVILVSAAPDRRFMKRVDWIA